MENNEITPRYGVISPAIFELFDPAPLDLPFS